MNAKINEPNDATIFLARQSILDRNQDLYGYELLYRNARTGSAIFSDENFATTKLINNTFVEFGIEKISENKPVFINLPRAFLTGDIPLPMQPHNVVLEILEDVIADDATINGIKALAEAGFRFALDDFVLNENNALFIEFADIIKVDITNKTSEELTREVEILSTYKVTLLAEKVETLEEFQHCMSLGFSYFQGYFFCKPKLIEARELPANQTALLNLLAKLQAPDIEIEEIETIISQDVSISFKLLKIINSSLYNFNKEVESIQHALVILGMNTLKQWLTLLSLSAIENKPLELISHTLRRAKMCEVLSKNLAVKSDSAFTVGMFSLLDALMDNSLETIISSLPLSQEVTLAITREHGELGNILMTIRHFEQGNWSQIHARYHVNNNLHNAYQEAISWQQQITQELAKIK